jgi:phage terminase large subunit-like protein
MGSLKAGATYIYERDKGKVYAREFGSDPATRTLIGWDYDPKSPDRYMSPSEVDMASYTEWMEIKKFAKTNPALQIALDNVILIHKITKDYSNE